MIAVRLEGRLGNQLFQYAFAYATAKKFNTSFYLDKSVDVFLLPKYFEVKKDFPALLDDHIFSITGFKNVFYIHFRRGFYRFLNAVAVSNKTTTLRNWDNPEDALARLKDHCLYVGFFQSVDYFSACKEEIRELFRIKPNFIHEFKNVWNRLQEHAKKAVVHIRRGDYVDLDIALPLSYYRNAIAAIGRNNVQYIFISDDPALIRQEFSDIENSYISAHDEITDLQLLANADYCVLSGSSFSWWGAWLNNNPDKKIFAPKYWLGFKEQKEFPAGIGDQLNFNWVPL